MMFVRLFVFFFKQKTAYEMRISDWSSDVCSSDLALGRGRVAPMIIDTSALIAVLTGEEGSEALVEAIVAERGGIQIGRASCRERVCSVRVDLGGRRIIKKKTKPSTQ